MDGSYEGREHYFAKIMAEAAVCDEPRQVIGQDFVWDGNMVLQEISWHGDGTRSVVDWHHEPRSFVPLARKREALDYIGTDQIGTPR